MIQAGGRRPVIPDFGKGSSCVTGDHVFCWDWVQEHWSDTLEPKLVDHIELTLIAVAHRLRDRVRRSRCSPIASAALDSPIGIIAALVYTIPSIALFQILIPTLRDLHAHDRDRARRVRARDPLPEHHRRAPRRAARRARGGARHGPASRARCCWRIELPLAVPSIIGGLRIAVVSTVSIATIAAILGGRGLGQPIFDALALPTPFKTEIYAAGALVVALALTCDLLLVLLRRVLVPWTRAGR